MKSEEDAFSALEAILHSRKLKSSSHPEFVEFHHEEKLMGGVEIPPFCCVAEIPIQHLSYHSKRYGNLAIGFERNYLLGERFRPVSYFLKHDDFMLPALLSLFKFVDENTKGDRDHIAWKNLWTLSTYIKGFSVGEFDSIYSEREWRHWGDFDFSPEDVKFVLTPKKYIKKLRSNFSAIYSDTNFLEYELLLEH